MTCKQIFTNNEKMLDHMSKEVRSIKADLEVIESEIKPGGTGNGR